jgi:succinyl-diaminopimelate desuccinylase
VSGLDHRLAARTLELVDIPSESRHEQRIAAHVRSLVPPAFAPAYEAEDAFVWARERTGKPLVLLAGHYDTVPAQGNIPGRIGEGSVHGLGATDMKAGLAVMLELARDLAEEELAVDLGLLAFGKEELPASESPLPHLFENCPLVHEAALAILLEPTDVAIQAGCVGNLNATITFSGVSGHSARPWLADNAIDRAIEGLAALTRRERREAIVGGLPFYEVLSLTRIGGGIADNVIPDRVTAHLNFRYAPDRSPASAAELIRSLVPDGAELELAGDSPPGLVPAGNPLLERLRALTGLPVEPKQAWTNVADFTSRGIDAINLGPGSPKWAHARDEQVEIEKLVRSYEALRSFLTTG